MAKRLQLRALNPAERAALRAKIRDLSLAARIHQRYRVIELVRRGFGLVDVSARVGCHFTVANDWVRRFNQKGFSQFEQVPNPRGRPPILRAKQLRKLVDAVLSSASERGLPFSVWSVSKLAEYCRGRNLLPPVTDEWVRQLRIHPVRTPTEASCINLIEAQFGVLKRFTVAPSADPTHAARRQRIDPYLRYRHRKLQNLRHPLHCIRSVSPIKLE